MQPITPPYLASLFVINAHKGSCPEFQAFCPFIVHPIALLKAFDLRLNAIER